MKPQTITAFAKRFGLSRSTLLYYDRIGLLKPAGFSPNGYRLYGERETARMRRIDTFRKAGIPLKAIREILDGMADDGEGGGGLEAALERRLIDLNQEIGQLHAQQRLVASLLRREGKRPRVRSVDVTQWVAMLEEAGLDEVARQRWHSAFERDAPEAHQEFLVSLGLDEEEIAEIRRRSREPESSWVSSR